MRLVLFLILASACGSGCIHNELKRRTVNQASTLGDLQVQQVLDNVAMFVSRRDSIAWHLKPTGGLVQIADQGNVGFEANLASSITADLKHIFSPSLGAQRAIVNQWEGDPTNSAEDLELLELAYRKAITPWDPELPKDLRFAIYEIYLTYNLAPGSEILLDIMKDAVKEEEERLLGEVEQLRTAGSESSIDLVRASITCGYDHIASLVEGERLGEELDNDSQIRKSVAAAAFQFGIASSELAATFPAPNDAVKSLRRRLSLLCQAESQLAMINVIPQLNPFRDSMRGMFGTSGQPGQLVASDGESHGDPSIKFFIIAGHERYVIPQAKAKMLARNPGLVDQAEAKLNTLKELLKTDRFDCPWFGCGTRRDVPKGACKVGRYCDCNSECYIWVLPGRMDCLKELTLDVMKLAPVESQDLVGTSPGGGGAAFSPSLR